MTKEEYINEYLDIFKDLNYNPNELIKRELYIQLLYAGYQDPTGAYIALNGTPPRLPLIVHYRNQIIVPGRILRQFSAKHSRLLALAKSILKNHNIDNLC